MVDAVMRMPEGTRGYLLAPMIRDRKGEYRKELLELRKQGFQRVKVDGTFYDLDEPPTLDKKLRHDIDVVVDRIVVREGLETRLADSFRTALDLASGIAVLETAPREGEGEPERITFSENFACPVSGFTIPEIEPRLFSFNAPFGACPACDGLGAELFFDERLIVPDAALTLADGALAPWRKGKSPYFLQTIEAMAKHYGFDAKLPWRDLPERVREVFLHGSGKEAIAFRYDEGGRVYEVKRPFEGIVPNIERRYRETESNWVREEFERYRGSRPCGVCEGYRLRPEALAVKIAGLHVGQVVRMSIAEALDWAGGVNEALSPQRREIARAILKEIRERLGFLNNVGLQYLTLARGAGTLSGGESQRIRLASQIGSGLTGVLYVLDEPSIGLHQRDNDRLLTTLKNLRDQGNSVIVVEHDEEAIREADYVFDMGPGAGVHGGRIVSHGTPADVMADPASLTGQYLSGAREIAVPAERRRGNGRAVTVVNATGNNLRGHHGRSSRSGKLHLRHRRFGRGQVHADHRDAVQDRLHAAQRRAAGAGALRDDPGAGAPRQGDRHRPAPDRPHPALQPGHLHRRLRADPGLVRRAAGGQGAGLQARAVLLQRQGRALRGLPGRRGDQDRDAFFAGRVRDLRNLPRRALQPRDSGSSLQGQEHRRRS